VSLIFSIAKLWKRLRPAARSRAALRLFLALLLISPGKLGAQSQAGEYAVKAAFLFNFAKFIDWPTDSFKNSSDPLTYCVAGDDPFGDSLDQALAGKTIGGHPVRLLRPKKPEDADVCQIIFLASKQEKLSARYLEHVKDHSVLTVGEADDFLRQGGIIRFILEDNRVRFEINLTTAEHAKLKVSSRLLALARNVLGAPSVGG